MNFLEEIESELEKRRKQKIEECTNLNDSETQQTQNPEYLDDELAEIELSGTTSENSPDQFNPTNPDDFFPPFPEIHSGTQFGPHSRFPTIMRPRGQQMQQNAAQNQTPKHSGPQNAVFMKKSDAFRSSLRKSLDDLKHEHKNQNLNQNQAKNNDFLVELEECHHFFHSFCLKGYMIIGKQGFFSFFFF